MCPRHPAGRQPNSAQDLLARHAGRGLKVLPRSDCPYDVGEGWGIIGTHIHPDAGRSGLGRRLFATSLAAAKAAGLRHIDASIGIDNSAALGYYAAMGFTPYREGENTIAHRFDVQ